LNNELFKPAVRDAEKALERKPFKDPMRWLQRYRSDYLNFPFDDIKYKSPHSKALEAFLTEGPIFFHFKALKFHQFRKKRKLLGLIDNSLFLRYLNMLRRLIFA
jgi:hypothetical protein